MKQFCSECLQSTDAYVTEVVLGDIAGRGRRRHTCADREGCAARRRDSDERNWSVGRGRIRPGQEVSR